jgi:hypothetical protein
MCATVALFRETDATVLTFAFTVEVCAVVAAALVDLLTTALCATALAE